MLTIRSGALLALVLCYGTLGIGGDVGNEPTGAVVPEHLTCEFGGPVAVKVVLRNDTRRPLWFFFSDTYPMYALAIKASLDAPEREQAELPSVSMAPISVGPGKEHVLVVYLNDLVNFKHPGEFKLEYELRVPYLFADEKLELQHARACEAKGSIAVTLARVTHEDLRKRLRAISQDLTSKDEGTKREAARALCCLDDPVAVEFIGQVLAVRDFRLMAVTALRRFETPEAVEFMKSVLRADEDPAVVAVVLREFGKRGLVIEKDRIARLLGSDGIGVRLHTVRYVSRLGTRDHMSLIEPLLKDENAAVAKAAQECIEELRKKK